MRCGRCVNVTLNMLLRCMSRSVRVTLCGKGLVMPTCQSNGFANSADSLSVVAESFLARSCCWSSRSTTSGNDTESKSPAEDDDGLGASASKAARVFGKPVTGCQRDQNALGYSLSHHSPSDTSLSACGTHHLRPFPRSRSPGGGNLGVSPAMASSPSFSQGSACSCAIQRHGQAQDHRSRVSRCCRNCFISTQEGCGARLQASRSSCRIARGCKTRPCRC